MDIKSIVLAALCVAAGGAVGWFMCPSRSLHAWEPPISHELAQSAQNVIPVVVIGSGPAGLTAGMYGARFGYKTLIIAGNKPGGALTETTWVENWAGIDKQMGPDIVANLQQQADRFGAEFLYDAVASVDFSTWPFTITTEDGINLKALSVIIASGSSPRTLGVPGEKEYWGKGVTTCAVCDAPFHKNKDVIVVGGGDSAVEESLQVSPYARSVTVLVRGDSMRAAASMQERLKAVDNITVLYNTQIQKIIGNGNEVTDVEMINTKTDKVTTKPVSGVFLAIGHNPNSQVFKDQIALDDNNYIVTLGRSQHTTVAGVFAAGDVQDPVYKQANASVGYGTNAAIDANAFLQDHGFNKDVLASLEQNYFEVFMQDRVEVKQVSDLAELNRLIETTQGCLVIDYYAPTCPSCMRMLPAVEAVASQFKDKVTFVKVDTSEALEIAREFKVKSIPLMMVYCNGSLSARNNQAMTKQELIEFVSRFI